MIEITSSRPDPKWAESYELVEAYAQAGQLQNTLKALPLVQDLVFRTGGMSNSPFEDAVTKLRHCLAMARILIDLHIPVEREEEDILLASALCHILPASSELFQSEGILDPRVFETIRLIRLGDAMNDEKLAAYTARVQENRLALLLRLADRGNLVEQLHSFSGWSTRRYIYETRNFYLPMCVYGKEHYPDLIAPVSILMEKMRSLTEVAEILLGRYEARETELTREILDLQEENARIRDAIRAFRSSAQ